MRIRILLFFAAFCISLFLTGSLGLGLLKKKASVFSAFTWGLVFMLAIFQVIAYPLYRLRASFQLLFVLFTAVMGCLLLYALWRLFVQKKILAYGECAARFFREAKTLPVTLLLTAMAVGAYLYLSFCYAYTTTDDGYYMPRAMEILANNSLAIPNSVAWLGEYVDSFLKTTDASTLEFFKAYLSYCSGIPVTILCRNALNLAFSLVSLSAIFNLAGELAADRKNTLRIQLLSVIFYCGLLIINSRVNDTAAFWSFCYIWQGKSMLCAIIFPMLATGCAWVVNSGDGPVQKSNWVLISALLTAGIAASVVGAFLPFIFYFTLGLPYLLVCGWKKARTMLVPILLSALPVLLFSGLTYLDIVTSKNFYLTMFSAPVWMEQFNKLFAPHRYLPLILYLGGLLYACIRGNRLVRLLLVGQSVVLFLTFLNPLLIGPVSKYITTGSVYWRLYWLLPVNFLPAFALADVVARISVERFRCIALTLVCALAVQVGIGVYKEGWPTHVENLKIAYGEAQYVAPRTNLYVLDQSVVDVADLILRDYDGAGNARVVITDQISYAIRQYTNELHLACGVRKGQREYLTMPVPGTNIPQNVFYQRLFAGEIHNDVYLYNMLQRLGVDYICFQSGILPANIKTPGMRYLSAVGKYTVWKIEG